jgi:hypothetical protein
MQWRVDVGFASPKDWDVEHSEVGVGFSPQRRSNVSRDSLILTANNYTLAFCVCDRYVLVVLAAENFGQRHLEVSFRVRAISSILSLFGNICIRFFNVVGKHSVPGFVNSVDGMFFDLTLTKSQDCAPSKLVFDSSLLGLVGRITYVAYCFTATSVCMELWRKFAWSAQI